MTYDTMFVSINNVMNAQERIFIFLKGSKSDERINITSWSKRIVFIAFIHSENKPCVTIIFLFKLTLIKRLHYSEILLKRIFQDYSFCNIYIYKNLKETQ